ncbi:MAG: T9SS type A sorting domain-containing protein [Crocinitomicaceae bacterium]|nr:T9SS type A sorting domain-containing protein [Crocinitomicaceae bacterium]
MKKNFTLLILLMSTFVSFAQDRVTLIESFTSSTCPPCNAGNVHLEGILADAQNDNKQVSLKYQMSWPGDGDPYFTDEGGVRRNLYGISSVPLTIVDGTNEYSTGNITQANLDNAYAIAPKALITTTYSVDITNQTVDVSVDVEALVNTDAGLRLHVAIFEYLTVNNVGSNGETEFEHVMKKMLPDAKGSFMPALAVGEHFYYNETYTFNGNYRLPNNANDQIDHAIEHSVEEFSDLGIAAWVQSDGPGFEVNSPAGVAGPYAIGTASFGGAIPTTPMTEDLVIFDDNTGGDPYDACEPAVNAAQLNGNIAVIRRGSCEFGCKAEEAQNAGAVAAVIVNNVPGAPVTMGEGVCGPNVTIPVIMIGQTEGEALITEIEGGSTVNVTLVDKGLEVYQAGYGEMLSSLDEDIIESSVKIYPNPSSESAIVTLRLSNSQDVAIELVDMMGQVVSSRLEKNVEAGRTYHKLNTSILSNGIYTVKLFTGSMMISKRLVVKN